MRSFLYLILFASWIAGCASNAKDTDPVSADPSFAKSRLEVQTEAKKQIQRDDFNGIFRIEPDRVMIEQEYWTSMYNKWTQPGSYGKFFNEFNIEMNKLASYYGDDEKKERMMASAERSFYEFCVSMNIAEEYREWRNQIAAW